MQGMIHIYTGDGKGKTTAAAGLAVRAAGRKKRVLFVQFLKDNSSGEAAPLRQIGVTVRGLTSAGFVWQLSDAEKQHILEAQNQMLQTVLRECSEGIWDMVIMDEIMAACQTKLADETMVDALIARKPDAMELVLTGRNAPQKWIEQAHYVTELIGRKHPYGQNIPAREGIEY